MTPTEVSENALPSHPVVLWIDDDQTIFELLGGQVDPELLEVIVLHRLSDLSDRGLWRHLERIDKPALICLWTAHEPLPEEFRRVFSEFNFTGVISDLEIGGNPLAGMLVLSAAASSPFRPRMAIFSGKTDRTIEGLASALGVTHVIKKSPKGSQRIREIVFKWLDVQKRYNETRESKRLGNQLEQLQQDNAKLKKERLRLRQQIKSLTPIKASGSTAAKKKQLPEEGVATLKAKLNELERQIQLVLAHHHDLTNTSSFTVQSLDQLMSEPRMLPPVVAEELERARISAKHCDVLVSSLTTLSLKANDRQKPSPSSLTQALGEALQIVRRKVPETVTLTQQVQSRLALCAIPEHLLVRCILNLLLNSIEALAAGGTIVVRVYPSKGRSRSIKVQVVDNGKGIKKVDLQKVFDPDFSSKGKQHGLGLFIVKKVMDDFGGSISIKSIRGQGTTVTLNLPLA